MSGILFPPNSGGGGNGFSRTAQTGLGLIPPGPSNKSSQFVPNVMKVMSEWPSSASNPSTLIEDPTDGNRMICWFTAGTNDKFLACYENGIKIWELAPNEDTGNGFMAIMAIHIRIHNGVSYLYCMQRNPSNDTTGCIMRIRISDGDYTIGPTLSVFGNATMYFKDADNGDLMLFEYEGSRTDGTLYTVDLDTLTMTSRHVINFSDTARRQTAINALKLAPRWYYSYYSNATTAMVLYKPENENDIPELVGDFTNMNQLRWVLNTKSSSVTQIPTTGNFGPVVSVTSNTHIFMLSSVGGFSNSSSAIRLTMAYAISKEDMYNYMASYTDSFDVVMPPWADIQ